MHLVGCLVAGAPRSAPTTSRARAGDGARQAGDGARRGPATARARPAPRGARRCRGAEAAAARGARRRRSSALGADDVAGARRRCAPWAGDGARQAGAARRGRRAPRRRRASSSPPRRRPAARRSRRTGSPRSTRAKAGDPRVTARVGSRWAWPPQPSSPSCTARASSCAETVTTSATTSDDCFTRRVRWRPRRATTYAIADGVTHEYHRSADIVARVARRWPQHIARARARLVMSRHCCHRALAESCSSANCSKWDLLARN